MADPAIALQTAYKAALADLSYGGQLVAVYDTKAANDAAAPYVLLTASASDNEDTKTTIGRGLEINLDVVTRFGPGARSSLPAEAIADILEARFCPFPGAITLAVSGFVLWKMTYIGRTRIETPTGTGTLVRRILTIDHSLHPA